MLAKKLGFGSFVFVCNNPTHNLSSIKLFIIFVAFLVLARCWDSFCLVSGCNDPTFYPSYFDQGGLIFLGMIPPSTPITPVTWLSLSARGHGIAFVLPLGVLWSYFDREGFAFLLCLLGVTSPLITLVTWWILFEHTS